MEAVIPIEHVMFNESQNYYNFVMQYRYFIVCLEINYDNSRPIVPISMDISIIIFRPNQIIFLCFLFKVN